MMFSDGLEANKCRGCGIVSDRKAALENALKQIEKQFGKGSIMRMNETQIANDIQVIYNPAKFGGQINFMLAANTSKLQTAYQTLLNQFILMSNNGYYTQQLLDKAKADLIENKKRSIETVSDQNILLANSWLLNSFNWETNFEESINQISTDDLANFAALYLNHQVFISGLVISPAQKQMYQTDSFFMSTKGAEDYEFNFTKNDATFLGVENQIKLQSLIQWLKINDGIKMELSCYQDAVERKETARDRFVSMYKTMLDAGLSSDLLQSIPVSIFIQHGISESEIQSNQKVVLKIVK